MNRYFVATIIDDLTIYCTTYRQPLRVHNKHCEFRHDATQSSCTYRPSLPSPKPIRSDKVVLLFHLVTLFLTHKHCTQSLKHTNARAHYTQHIFKAVVVLEVYYYHHTSTAGWNAISRISHLFYSPGDDDDDNNIV